MPEEEDEDVVDADEEDDDAGFVRGLVLREVRLDLVGGAVVGSWSRRQLSIVRDEMVDDDEAEWTLSVSFGSCTGAVVGGVPTAVTGFSPAVAAAVVAGDGVGDGFCCCRAPPRSRSFNNLPWTRKARAWSYLAPPFSTMCLTVGERVFGYDPFGNMPSVL